MSPSRKRAPVALPAEFVKGVAGLDGLPKAPVPEIAASGRSNVGKSSMLNVLFGRRSLAKVSRTPGRTREINFFSIGGRWHLVDLPGYGYARVPANVSRKWGALVREYLETRGQLAGILQLVDARHGPTALDGEMLEWLAAGPRPALIVATKVDKLKRSERARRLRAVEEAVGGFPVVPFSAVTREGRAEVLAWMDETVAAWRDGGRD